CSLIFTKKINYKKMNCNTYKLSIKGLKGGHSGDDINKNRCNAIKLAIRLLKELDYKEISDIQFGKCDNVIPSEGYVIFSSDKDIEMLRKKIDNIELNLSEEDSNITLNLEKIESRNFIKESKDITEFITKIKDGLLETYQDDNFPLLSANIGKISILNNTLEIKYSIRSSDLEKEEMLLNDAKLLANHSGFEMIIDAKKPFFPFKENSLIRNILAESYKKLYGQETIVKKIHACMESGILSNNIENLDICTIAPTIDNCHSINERVSISSTQRVYDWLKETLIEYNKKNQKTKENNINDNDYEEICPTAIVTSYQRIFTDIPYEKEIYKWLENHCHEEVTLVKNFAPEIEARYKLTNKLLDKYNIKQVLELASGYSSRGLIYSQKGYSYVELDLEQVTNKKKEILHSIE
ncbi:MAG: hypothetical protein K2J20_00120, partial [Bacilli bacterium]|nr:hypothetical protein [Bacilli bacterium]